MTEISLGPYRLRVDAEGTRAYYESHPLSWLPEEENPYGQSNPRE